MVFMLQNRIIKNTVFFLIMLLNLGCDQFSKTIVREKISSYETISLVDHYVTLTKVENKGAFLSLGSALPDAVKFLLLSGIPLMALAFGIVYLFTRRHLSKLSMLALSFAIGGGIGNIYDRMIRGSVTDFLHIDFGLFQTGIFNMADVSIMVALLIYLFQSLTIMKHRTDRHNG